MKRHNREWVLGQLAKSLRLLAAPGSAAVAKLPGQGTRSAEFLSAFADIGETLLTDFSKYLSDQQRRSLLALDDAIVALATQERAEGWLEAAARRDPYWEDVRQCAHDALDAFNWTA